MKLLRIQSLALLLLAVAFADTLTAAKPTPAAKPAGKPTPVVKPAGKPTAAGAGAGASGGDELCKIEPTDTETFTGRLYLQGSPFTPGSIFAECEKGKHLCYVESTTGKLGKPVACPPVKAAAGPESGAAKPKDPAPKPAGKPPAAVGAKPAKPAGAKPAKPAGAKPGTKPGPKPAGNAHVKAGARRG